MNEAVRFLSALSQALAAIGLYGEGHPARARAVDAAHEALIALLQIEPRPRFSFVGDDVLFGRMPLRDLKKWDWGLRLSQIGIQWVQFDEMSQREDLETFIIDAGSRLANAVDPKAAHRRTSVRYGVLGIRGQQGADLDREITTATTTYSLTPEAEAVRWIVDETINERDIPLLEAEAVIRSLAVAMHQDRNILVPLVRLKETDEYSTAHSINVSVLTMSLAEYAGLSGPDVRACGVAALLHDVGMTRVPKEVVYKTAPLTPMEVNLLKQHTVHGARILMAREKELSLAAMVAYEHHMTPDGSGYPRMRFPRAVHYVSRMVRITATYDAMRSDRPFRRALDGEQALRLLEKGAGKEFDGDLVRPFITMMRAWEWRVAEEQGVPVELDF